AHWFSITDLPEVIFDHAEMIDKAIRRLRYKTSQKPIGFELLPEKFTMRELQKLYEAILGIELDKRNFINKINALDILVKLKEKDMNSSRNVSFIFRFDVKKYIENFEDLFSYKL